MTDSNNNNIVSVERDICTGIGKNTIHQLNKLDEKLGKRKRVRIYPITYIQAVYDAGYEEWILWNAANRYTEGGLLPEEEN